MHPHVDPAAVIPPGWVSTQIEPGAEAPPDAGRTLLAVDCEMVETEDGTELARVSVVDESGACLYDELVLPQKQILNYLTQFSGISAEMMVGVETRLEDVQRHLLTLLTPTTILVGHRCARFARTFLNTVSAAHTFL